MEEIRVNRLPAITWRYLHVNDSPDQFEFPGSSASAVFSDKRYVSEGGTLPADFCGASAETLVAAEKGQAYTVIIPENTEAELTISITAEEDRPDFAGCFIFKLEKDAKLNLIWRLSGDRKHSVFATASFYELMENAALSVSYLETGLPASSLYEQRNAVLGDDAKLDFVSAELGGEKVIVHSYGRLAGSWSEMRETALYAAAGRQSLDLFYHIDHIGKESNAVIDVKGALSDTAKKNFSRYFGF